MNDLLTPVHKTHTTEIAVVGAGIIGLSIALELRARGHEVCVVERDDIAAGASRGNAGAFAYSDIFPLASPNIIRKVPRWLLDPLGPLTLRPAYLPTIAPWLWKFWKASRPTAFEASIQSQVALMRLAQQATPRLLKRAGAEHLLRQDGNLHVYESRAEWERSLPEWNTRALHGIAFEHLHGAENIAHRQGGLSKALVAATFVPAWHTIRDPYELCMVYAHKLRAMGASHLRANISAVRNTDSGAKLSAHNMDIHAKRVVLAAGAWSNALTRTLSVSIPLETERGYNTTLPAGAFELKRQITFPGHGFVMTPTGGGVRVGGAVELGGLHAPPNFARADALLMKAKRFAPELNTQGGKQWMGLRPSLPDSLPAIGALKQAPNVLCAFGHGHLGLTQAAATAELVADLVAQKLPAISLAAFSPQRFD